MSEDAAKRDEDSKISVHVSDNDPNQELSYQTTQSDNPFFIRNLQYSRKEEARVIRVLDTRLFPWVLLTTFVLNMDRTNLSNAISDNLPQDLGFNINVVNTGIAMYAVLFSAACLSGSVIAKRVGPSRWIPILMFAWGLVTCAHALIKNKAGYLTGGVIPATLVYLGGFYKSTELATRLAWFWGIQSIASAVSGLMASGLLQLGGVAHLQGWKWLFLVDGIITVFVAVTTWFYLPRSVAYTKGGLRGWKPWFNDREIQIAITRVVQDDPAKRLYETVVKWADVKDAITDIGLWGHLIITMVGLTPNTPLQTCEYVNHQITPSGKLKTCLARLNILNDILSTNKLAKPDIQLIREQQIMSPLAVTSVFRTVWKVTGEENVESSCSRWTERRCDRSCKHLCNLGIADIRRQIYQADDSPYFKRGNIINIVFTGTAVILWFVQKFYYRYRNSRNSRRWSALNENERREVEEYQEKQGNRSIAFVFTN
ncbi:hypothetical protein PILCRDRAFT_71383 [Piloderma croceum F 1598]|uniref:Major facilitator superfamily (MFS) profile domain-containing protein n=1 Tax=Piloderma croceum (strain F 1598) TaxID=765440 RepID=A0A0C3B714_PILCF|nr:hypothetical protein PILCRDRAFT_71383 [Piloderma croceum F 1598]